MTDKILVFSTCSSGEEAERIARFLVDQRLAACVTVAPRVRSFYRWEGAVESAEEWLLIVKSSRSLFERLRLELQKVHSYEVPEIVAVSIADGSANYLNWIDEELSKAGL